MHYKEGKKINIKLEVEILKVDIENSMLLVQTDDGMPIWVYEREVERPAHEK